jgi:preprotein translocase subunit SecG
MGGQSAFGAKAGDVFTRVTMVTAGIWIALCMGSIWMLNAQDEWQGSDTSNAGFSSSDTDSTPESPSLGGVPEAEDEGDADANDDGDSIGGAVGSGDDDAPSDDDSSSGGGDAAEAPATDAGSDEPSADEPESDS